MHQDRFGTATRSPGATASRRDVSRAQVGGGLGVFISSAFAALAADAKKKRDKRNKKPKSKTVTRTVRQLVTQTFASAVPITIPNGAPTNLSGPANPYPSTIAVSGFSNGVITDVNLILNDFTNTFPADVDLLLSHSDGRRALVMSDAGTSYDVTDIDLTLDDEAPAAMPDDQLTSRSYRPTNLENSDDDPFAAPAPALDGNVALSTFDGANPNGTWRLWAMDNSPPDHGDIGGWSLQITAEADVQVQERVPVTKAKKHKKGKKRKK
jgi:hypothetical protein